MAEMNDQDLNAVIELFAKLKPELAEILKQYKKENQSAAARQAQQKKEDLAKREQYRSTLELNAKIKQAASDGVMGKFIKGFTSIGRENFADTMKDFNKSLKDLDAAIKNTTDDSHKEALQKQRETVASNLRLVQTQQATSEFIKTFSKTAVSQISATTGSFVKSLQSGASSTDLSSTLMNGAVDLAAGSAGMLGGAMQGVGSAMSHLKGKAGYAGIALDLFGGALQSFAGGASKLAKFGIEVLSKEVEKTVNAFNSMSSSGALFANGMTGMRQAANSAGLTVEQFSKVVSANSSTLAESGLGVGEASRKMGAVSAESSKLIGSSGKSLQREMLQLGYSFEDQAALTAEVMADLRKGNQLKNMSDKQIAQETASYATNLRTIAAITGEDAKRKMEENRKAATQVAFRNKLQELEKKQPGVMNKIIQSMNTMDETSKKAFMEKLTMGNVVDKNANILMQQLPGMSEQIDGMVDLAKSGQFSVDEAQRLQGKTNDKMRANFGNLNDIGIAGMAGAGGLEDLNRGISGVVDNTDKVTEESVKSAQEAAKKQKETNDKLTDGVLSAEQAAQDLKLALEKELTPAIAKFAEVSKEMLGAVQDMLNDMGLGTKKKGKEEEFGSTAGGITGDIAGSAVGLGFGEVIGGAIGTAIAPGVGTVIGTELGGIAGTILGGLTAGAVGDAIGGAIGKGVDKFSNWTSGKKEEGYAMGGVSTGPTSGYQQLLHGTEAIVPLPDGKTIPVKLDMGDFTRNSMGQSNDSKSTNWGGAAMGAAIGTAILPGIGTALGGLLGGLTQDTKDNGPDMGVWESSTSELVKSNNDLGRAFKDMGFGTSKLDLGKMLGTSGLFDQNQKIVDQMTANQAADKNKERPSVLDTMGNAAIGAALGSMILPGVGTIVGGVLGSGMLDNFVGANDKKDDTSKSIGATIEDSFKDLMPYGINNTGQPGLNTPDINGLISSIQSDNNFKIKTGGLFGGSKDNRDTDSNQSIVAPGSDRNVKSAAAGAELNDLMKQQLDLLRQLVSKAGDQVDMQSSTRDLQQRLLDNSY